MFIYFFLFLLWRSRNKDTDTEKREVKNSECKASVLLIASTAVKNDADEQAADIRFYALVDTGADTSLCTRKLAEKLFGWKTKDEISIQFLEKAAESYFCMKQTLRLRYDKTKIVELNQISFIDTVLPYKECIPSDQALKKFDLSEECFSVIQNESTIDMILGAQDMRRFRLLETCKG